MEREIALENSRELLTQAFPEYTGNLEDIGRAIIHVQDAAQRVAAVNGFIGPSGRIMTSSVLDKRYYEDIAFDIVSYQQKEEVSEDIVGRVIQAFDSLVEQACNFYGLRKINEPQLGAITERIKSLAWNNLSIEGNLGLGIEKIYQYVAGCISFYHYLSPEISNERRRKDGEVIPEDYKREFEDISAQQSIDVIIDPRLTADVEGFLEDLPVSEEQKRLLFALYTVGSTKQPDDPDYRNAQRIIQQAGSEVIIQAKKALRDAFIRRAQEDGEEPLQTTPLESPEQKKEDKKTITKAINDFREFMEKEHISLATIFVHLNALWDAHQLSYKQIVVLLNRFGYFAALDGRSFRLYQGINNNQKRNFLISGLSVLKDSLSKRNSMRKSISPLTIVYDVCEKIEVETQAQGIFINEQRDRIIPKQIGDVVRRIQEIISQDPEILDNINFSPGKKTIIQKAIVLLANSERDFPLGQLAQDPEVINLNQKDHITVLSNIDGFLREVLYSLERRHVYIFAEKVKQLYQWIQKDPRYWYLIIRRTDFRFDRDNYSNKLAILNAAIEMYSIQRYLSATIIARDFDPTIGRIDGIIDRAHKTVLMALNENAGDEGLTLSLLGPRDFGEVLKMISVEYGPLTEITKKMNSAGYSIAEYVLGNLTNNTFLPANPRKFIDILRKVLPLTEREIYLLVKQLALEYVKKKLGLEYAILTVFVSSEEVGEFQKLWDGEERKRGKFYPRFINQLETLGQRLSYWRSTKKRSQSSITEKVSQEGYPLGRNYSLLERDKSFPHDPIRFSKAVSRVLAEDKEEQLFIEQDLIRACAISILKERDLLDLVFLKTGRRTIN